MNNNNQSLETPRWDLSSLYSSVTGSDYLKQLAEVEKQLSTLEKMLNSPENQENFPFWLSKFLEISEKTMAEYHSMSSFAYAAYSTDTTNSEYLNALSVIEEKGLKISQIDRKYKDLLSAHSQDLDNFYTSYPQYKNLEYIIQHDIQALQHTMSEAEENIADDLQRFGGSAWSRLHEQIISNSVDVETGKTFNELRNEAYHADRKVRKTAYEKEIALLKASEIPLSAALNNLKAATVTLNKRRKWDSAIQKSAFFNRLSEKTINALISAIEDSLPMWRSYLKTKAKILGIPKCAFYDIFAPLQNPDPKATPDKTWTFPEARNYIIEKFSGFSQHMGDFAKMAFEKQWIDAEVRKGKVGGAYCTEMPAQKESRVLSNFTGIFSDVITLSHELGHAYHNWCVKDLSYSQGQYPMTLAETASIFAETIVMQDMLDKTQGFQRAQLLEMHLSDANQVLVDILSRFYFERSVFQEREKGELGAADFCNLMADAQDKTYGDGLSEERHPYMWAVKTHYYSPDTDYYNYPYAFGLLFGLGLYSRYQSEGKSFTKVYQELLADTGSASCESVCKKAGFDIENKKFWASGIALYKNELEELEKYADSL